MLMKDAVHSLNSFFLYRYTDGKFLCTTSANVLLPKWDGEDGYQVAFPAPKAEGKDHKDQGNLVSR